MLIFTDDIGTELLNPLPQAEGTFVSKEKGKTSVP
jgi:hypothetical protein